MSVFEWLSDPGIYKQSFFDSLCEHPFFIANFCIMILLIFSCGIHQRIVMNEILIQRIRSVIQEYNLDCDQTGKLSLKQTFRRRVFV